MNLELKARSECALDVIHEMGPEIYFIILHFPDEFGPTDKFVSFKEVLPGGIVRWLLFSRDDKGHWRREA